MSTLQQILNVWGTAKEIKPRIWAGNSPIRPDSVKKTSFRLSAQDDDEHGVWMDYVTKEGGSLYDLAKRLNIEVPRNGNSATATDTKIKYAGIAEYAAAHRVPTSVYSDAKWEEYRTPKRFALRIPTKTRAGNIQYRYRGLDGQDPRWWHTDGYEPVWYGLHKAIDMCKKMDYPALVLVEGEPSVPVGQYYNIPAFCQSGLGANEIRADLLEELLQILASLGLYLIIALDCDEAGRKTAAKIHAQVPDSVVVDLKLSEHGDMCDFAYLWGKEHAYHELLDRGVKTPAIPTNSHAAAKHAVDNFFTAPAGMPIVFPFTSLHQFGGFAEVVNPKKLVYIGARSAGGKTSFMWSLVNMLLLRGVSIAYQGGEFSNEEYHSRMVQYFGGVSTADWDKWNLWKSESELGIEEGKRRGRPLTDAQVDAWYSANEKVNSLPARAYYLEDNFYIEDVLAELDMKMIQSRKEGYPIHAVFFDYANAYHVKSMGNSNQMETEFVVTLIKNWCKRNDMVGFVAIQVTKDASEKDRILTIHDLLGVRDHQTNCCITLNPIYEDTGEIDAFGNPKKRRANRAILNLCKNSNGVEGQVEVYTDFPRLRYLDKVVQRQTINLNED